MEKSMEKRKKNKKKKLKQKSGIAREAEERDALQTRDRESGERREEREERERERESYGVPKESKAHARCAFDDEEGAEVCRNSGENHPGPGCPRPEQ